MINLEDGKIEIDLTKFLTDVKNIQALPDKPAQTSNELKQLFDKAGEDIKNYINNELIIEIKEAFTKIFEVLDNKSEQIETSTKNIRDLENNIKQIEESTTIKKYRIKDLDDPQMPDGPIIDLPFYYKTNTDALDIYLNGEYLHRCDVVSGSEIADPEENPWVEEDTGSYYEVDEEGVPIINEELINKKIVKSNKIRLTSEWKVDGYDNLEIIVRGEVEK